MTAQAPAPGAPPPAMSLEHLARRYVWWSPPEVALRNRHRFIAQVMALGTWRDAHWLVREVGRDAFLDVLRAPPPGVLSPRAWRFWHLRLLGTPPQQPSPPGRVIPADHERP